MYHNFWDVFIWELYKKNKLIFQESRKIEVVQASLGPRDPVPVLLRERRGKLREKEQQTRSPTFSHSRGTVTRSLGCRGWARPAPGNVASGERGQERVPAWKPGLATNRGDHLVSELPLLATGPQSTELEAPPGSVHRAQAFEPLPRRERCCYCVFSLINLKNEINASIWQNRNSLTNL